MTFDAFNAALSKLVGTTVCVSDSGTPTDPDAASVHMLFDQGSWLLAAYWRVIDADLPGTSSFDHQQQYGLSVPVDAISWLQEKLRDRTVTDARLDERSGDLLFRFSGELELQVLNVTAYEVWEFHSPDGRVEYSNHLK